MSIDLAKIRNSIGSLSLTRQLPESMRQRFVISMLGVGDAAQGHEGDVLFTENDKSDELAYILITGEVEVQKSGMPSQEVSAPDLFGEIQQLNPEGVRTATLRVKDNAVLLRFSWNAFFALALTMFSEQEMATLRRALEDLAWSHTV